MRIRLAIPALILSALLILPLAAATLAGDHVDQQQTVAFDSFEVAPAASVASGYQHQSLAQTFTAGRSGVLDVVSLPVALDPFNAGEDDLIIEVRATTQSGAPSGDVVLASQTIANGEIPAFGLPVWIDVHFESPAQVTEGSRYAIVVPEKELDEVNQMTAFKLWVSQGDAYASGALYVKQRDFGYVENVDAVDLAFKTYVTAPGVDPDPDPVAELASGLAVIPAGDTSVTISPGLDVTSDSPVLVTPRDNLGNRALWVEVDPAADTFTIRMSSKSRSNTTIGWLAGEPSN